MLFSLKKIGPIFLLEHYIAKIRALVRPVTLAAQRIPGAFYCSKTPLYSASTEGSKVAPFPWRLRFAANHSPLFFIA